MGKNRELNEFERGQVIGFFIGGRTHEAIGRILKIPKSTITDTISRYKNSNTGLTAKRVGRPCSMNSNDRNKLSKIVKKKTIDFLLMKFGRILIVRINKFQL